QQSGRGLPGCLAALDFVADCPGRVKSSHPFLIRQAESCSRQDTAAAVAPRPCPKRYFFLPRISLRMASISSMRRSRRRSMSAVEPLAGSPFFLTSSPFFLNSSPFFLNSSPFCLNSSAIFLNSSICLGSNGSNLPPNGPLPGNPPLPLPNPPFFFSESPFF